MNRLLFCTTLLTGLLLSTGCRMCDTCYPIGGLLGKPNTECGCEKCTPPPPRVGSIIDTPELLDAETAPTDPSQISSGSPTDDSPGASGVAAP